MALRLNRCVFRPTAGGTGTWVVSAAIPGFRTPAQCTNPSVSDGQLYLYFAESDDQQNWEVGQGTYTVGSTTLTRTTIYDSSNGGAATSFPAAPKVAMGCPLAQSIPEILTGGRNYFVRADGSDSNDGLANSSTRAFLTIQKAFDVIADGIDSANQSININVADGTYTGAVIVRPPPIAQTLSLIGNTGTPASCIISTTSANAITVQPGARLTLSGFKLQTTTSGYGIHCSGTLLTTAMEYGAVANGHFYGAPNAHINIAAAYTISGGGQYHMLMDTGSTILCDSQTITVSGTPNFSTTFIRVQSGVAYIRSCTFSGAATGKRFEVLNNGVLNTAGGGASYFPGDSAGTGTNSGVSPWGLYL